MKYINHIILLLASFATSVFMASCSKDYDSDIDKLNATHNSIEQRVSSLETNVAAMNNQLTQLSVLAAAVEQNFYVTQVQVTSDGYELTLSNGRVIVLQNTPDNQLIPMPSISMTQLNGFFYWTLNGVVFTDGNGQPIRTTSPAPIVKYDYTLSQWLISIDGGVTFPNVNTYVSLVINDQVLLQIINNYISQHQTTFFSQQMLYQIISAYIQQNYKELFNVDILNEVVVNYVNEHYTRIFSYELLEKIFTQYNFEYIKENIKVDELVNVIISFIREHQEIFLNNEVLFEIVSNYIEMNKTKIFSEDILLEVINNFIENNQNYINIELLTQIITNYIDQHQDIVFNTETVRVLLMEYVKKYYVQMFSQNILIQVINTYITKNSTTIFNKKLIEELVNNYIKNNYTTIFTHEVLYEIVNNYIKVNGTTVFNRDVLIEVITNYFSKNYNLFIDRTVVSTAINDYIEKHGTTIIDIDIIRSIVYNYISINYREVFSIDILNKLIVNYFETHKEVLTHYVSEGNAVVTDVNLSDDKCTITLHGGQKVELVVFDDFARLRDRVQSIVALPNANGHFEENTFHFRYLVSPASMAGVIQDMYNKKHIEIELVTTDGNGSIGSISVYEPMGNVDGVLYINASSMPNNVKAIALHVKETKTGGTDIMTEFTVIDYKQEKSYLKCPDGNHPHMINLGLPSGTLWACCNVGANTPEQYGGYYAWGETWTKDEYSMTSYQYGGSNYSSYSYIGNDISGTEYDVAHVKWKESWQMPTADQMKELVNNCTIEMTTQNTQKGCKFTGANGGTIFLPSTGLYMGTDNSGKDSRGYYWSSTLTSMPTVQVSYIATTLYFSQKYQQVVETSDAGYRQNGLSVRPVAMP